MEVSDYLKRRRSLSYKTVTKPDRVLDTRTSVSKLVFFFFFSFNPSASLSSHLPSFDPSWNWHRSKASLEIYYVDHAHVCADHKTQEAEHDQQEIFYEHDHAGAQVAVWPEDADLDDGWKRDAKCGEAEGAE